MTEQRKDLRELQKLDIRIHEVKERIGSFDPLFEEVEEPALILEGELNTTRKRLQEMKLEERRLELATEEQRTRREKLEERLGSVRNLREEAAVSAELDMVKRTLQNNEQESLTLMDQLRKMEERSAELESAFAEATELVEPKKQELLDQRTQAEADLAAIRQERESFAGQIDASELKVYEAIRAGGRTVAIAPLTEDGACSHCFGMVPLQLQNELRHGDALIRCEGCGVILTAPDPEAEAAEAAAAAAAAAEASKASLASEEEPEDGADEEDEGEEEEGEGEEGGDDEEEGEEGGDDEEEGEEGGDDEDEEDEEE